MSGPAQGFAPPSSLAAEESLLGAMILRPSIIKDSAGMLDVSDFYKPAHQFVYNAMHSLHFTGNHVDAVTLVDQLRRDGVLEEIGGAEVVLELQNATPAISNWSRYADTVVEDARRRALIEQFSELTQAAYDYSKSPDEIIALAAALTGNHRIASRGGEIVGLFSLAEMAAAVDAQEDQGDKPWLVPNLLKPGWRIILVAGEGVGKAVLMRFIGIHAAAGIDLWDRKHYIEPRRVLYVDTENEAETIVHQSRIANREVGFDPIAQCEDRFHVWHRDGGLDLRNRRDLAEFEHVLEQTQPEILLAGPLYKLYRRHRQEDQEQAALEFTEILDGLRKRFGFALILEHHAPKASSGAFRELNPFGSSLFMRWPVLGLTLDFDGHVDHDAIDYQLNIGRFRRDRVIHDWPNAIIRSSMSKVAFTPYWRQGRYERLYQAARNGATI